MFSGFRSMLFGDAEPQQPVNSAIANNDETNHQASINELAKAPQQSVSLEQTLNAATTKFTEQLLPQQASIEQLQSSSHQLLPSLNEQQEQQQQKVVVEVVQQAENIVKDDEDDELIVNSWELLDLVENKVSINNEKDDDDDDIQIINNELDLMAADLDEQQQQQLCKSSSGILKSSNKGSVKQQQQQQLAKGQKPKVSFNTPDLVKGKRQNKIESRQVAAKNNDKPANNNNKGNSKSNKKDKQATRKTSGRMTKKPKLLNNLTSHISKPDTGDVFPLLSEPLGLPEEKRQEQTLNYAAAVLASKQQTLDTPTELCKQPNVPVEQGNGDLRTIKSVKRNRVNSTSHITSSEYEYLQNSARDELRPANAADKAEISDHDDNDNESIVSSGFSDCDYEYKGLDDYVMRPKRNMTKRGRNSKSTASLSQNSKRKSASSNKTKPSDDNNNNNSKADGGISFVAPKAPTASSSKVSKRRELELLAAERSEVVLKPKASVGSSCNLGETSNSNDSSDVAEMDESWYVTPPPCFTGSNGNIHKQVNNKTNNNNLSMISETPSSEALIENALIEHPSIYIASTSTSTTEIKTKTKAKSRTVVVAAAGGESFKSASNKKPNRSMLLRKLKSQESSSTSRATKQTQASGVESGEYTSKKVDLFEIDEDSCSATNENNASMGDDLDDFWKSGASFKRQVAPRTSQSPVDERKQLAKCKPVELVGGLAVKDSAASLSKQQAPVKRSSGKSQSVVANKQHSATQLEPSGSSLASSSRATGAVAVDQKKNKSAIAWRNKFIVDDWDLDDQEDPTSDFDVMFEPVRKKKALGKSRRKQQKLQSATATLSSPEQVKLDAEKESSAEVDSLITYHSNVISTTLNSVEPQVDSGATSDQTATVKLVDLLVDDGGDDSKENERVVSSGLDSSSVVVEFADSSAPLAPITIKKAAIQVRPIEPERKPGWQLKRQRSNKRRPSASSSSPPACKSSSASTKEQRCSSSSGGSLSLSPSSSARSSPTLIDRIGSSIVANLSTLTSGFAPVNAMLVQAASASAGGAGGACNMLLQLDHRSPAACGNGAGNGNGNGGGGGGASGGALGERHRQQQQQQQALASRANKLAALGETRANELVARKQLARNSLRRQNGVACGQATQRRADRRLRMFARPNGCSINRKVQTNY